MAFFFLSFPFFSLFFVGPPNLRWSWLTVRTDGRVAPSACGANRFFLSSFFRFLCLSNAEVKRLKKIKTQGYQNAVSKEKRGKRESSFWFCAIFVVLIPEQDFALSSVRCQALANSRPDFILGSKERTNKRNVSDAQMQHGPFSLSLSLSSFGNEELKVFLSNKVCSLCWILELSFFLFCPWFLKKVILKEWISKFKRIQRIPISKEKKSDFSILA